MGQETSNPYASALDGLSLEDPVQAFFDFCREREQIRVRREAGDPAPWSEDPIFQQGRFLNVFREDDRGSKAILRFAAPLSEDLPALIHALFFARWCNRQSTLDALPVALLNAPEELNSALDALPEQPWCNVTAYPVEPVSWKGRLYSRLESATRLFGEIKGTLTESIQACNGDVIQATQAVNALFKMENDFPIFMAIMDIAWFRPDIIDPGSPVPTGIGAAPFLDRLQEHLGLDSHQQTCEEMMRLQGQYWPEAKRRLQPIDIEYLSCECRKYWSYHNGTKNFEGKNRFQAGLTPHLEFDIVGAPPAEPLQTQICVIAGGPCSGKTTLIEALQSAGHTALPETARVVLEAGIREGRTAEEMRADPVQWQQTIFQQDHAVFDSLPTDQPVFTDTSFIETLVFGDRAGLSAGPNLRAWLEHKRYKHVFFLDPLAAYEETRVRLESQKTAQQISEQVWQAYLAYGYQPTVVPAGTVTERTAFIVAILKGRHL